MTPQPPAQQTPAFAEFKAMSDRTREVLAMLIGVMSEGEAAATLGVGRNTIHGYVKRIYAVMRVHSRQELRSRIEQDKQLLERIHELQRRIQSRQGRAGGGKAAARAKPRSHVEVRVHIERTVLAALRERVDNLPHHLAELARREAHRLKSESPPV